MTLLHLFATEVVTSSQKGLKKLKYKVYLSAAILVFLSYSFMSLVFTNIRLPEFGGSKS